MPGKNGGGYSDRGGERLQKYLIVLGLFWGVPRENGIEGARKRCTA